MCQKKVWATLKKEEKRKYPCQKSMIKKMPKSMNNPMLKSMKKKRERKKIAHTIKRQPSKERAMHKGV